MELDSERRIKTDVDNGNDIHLPQTKLHDGFILGDALVFADKGYIVVNNEHFHVPPKALEVLLLLVENQGETVSAEMLLEFVWGDKNTSRANLTHAISELRHALKDSKDCPKYIQTLPRKGYRLIYPIAFFSPDEKVSMLWNQTGKSIAISSRANSDKQWYLSWSLLKSSRLFSASIAFVIFFWVLLQVLETIFPIFNFPPWSLRFLVLILIAIFPAAVLLIWFKELKERKSVSNPEDKFSTKLFYRQVKVDSVFVVGIFLVSAFLANNLIGALEQDYNATNQPPSLMHLPKVQLNNNALAIMRFSEGTSGVESLTSSLQEELIVFFSQIKHVNVLSKRAVNSLSQDVSLKDIISLLGVRYILEGSTSLVEDQVNVTATLVDTVNGFQLWSSKVVGNSDNLLALQTELFRQAYSAVSHALPESADSNIKIKPTDDYQAYDFYVRAKSAIENDLDVSSLKEAESLYSKALARDKNFVLAAAGLCQTYLAIYQKTKNTEHFEMGRQSCLHAQSMASQQVPLLTSLGDLYRISGQYDDSKKYYFEALERKPEYYLATIGLASLYEAKGQEKQAEQAFLDAIEQSPAEWFNYHMYGVFLFTAGRYQEAIAPFLRVTLLARNNATAFNSLGASYYLTANFEEASKSWLKSHQIEPSALTYSNLGTAYFFERRFRESENAYQQALLLTPEDGLLWANLGDSRKYLGKSGAAQTAYNKAVELLKANLAINDKQYSIVALLAKLYSELSQCQLAGQYASNQNLVSASDPYIFYDLAIMAINCHQSSQVRHYLKLMLSSGYPVNLLKQDPVFQPHLALVAELMTTTEKEIL